MDKDQFSVLKDQNATLQKSLDGLSNDREHDVKKIEDLTSEMQEVRIRLGAMESQIDEMRKQLKGNLDKTSDRVIEVIAPLQEQIQKKKIVEYTVKPWYKFWK